jgi:hypothetical protein
MSRQKKAKGLIPKTSKDCNVSEELVGDVIDFYYTELRKKMEGLEDVSIGVPVLGTFEVSRPKLIKSIKKITDMLSSDKPETFKLLKRYNLTNDIRDKQKQLLEKLESEKHERDQRKKNISE